MVLNVRRPAPIVKGKGVKMGKPARAAADEDRFPLGKSFSYLTNSL